MQAICTDLKTEHDELEDVLADLDEDQWLTPTPFLTWKIKDEIRHLAYFDDRAALAATDPDGFQRHLEEVITDWQAFEKTLQEVGRELSPEALLKWWREQRRIMLDALIRCDPKDRLPWYGPPMSALSFTTARLMETWAHAQDVFDTLRIKRTPTNRLRHIAHLGVRTFGWTYKNRGLEVPETTVRVALTAPSGDSWTWGPEDADQQIAGPAEDFCLVVVQRRHVADTALAVTGDVAQDWMLKAQCFAGPPADGPKPGQRTVQPR